METDQRYTKGDGSRFRDNFTGGERVAFRWGVAAGLALGVAIEFMGRILT